MAAKKKKDIELTLPAPRRWPWFVAAIVVGLAIGIGARWNDFRYVATQAPAR